MKLLLIAIIFTASLFASKADDYFFKGQDYFKAGSFKSASYWYERSFKLKKDKDTAFNIGLAYEKQKIFESALLWYEKASSLGESGGAINMGSLYEEINDDNNAIKWYEKAYVMGNLDASSNLGLLYESRKNNYKKAIHWYMLGLKKSHFQSIQNLANLFIKQGEKTKGGAYFLALLAMKPEKKVRLIKYLKTKWNLTEQQIKKAYELQKTLVPKPYLGGL